MKQTHPSIITLGSVLIGLVIFSACATSQKGSSAADGGQVPGLYKNEQYRFTLNYPKHWTGQPLQESELLRVAEPNAYATPNATATVEKLTGPGNLDTKAFMDAIKAKYPGSGRFKVLDQEEFALNDGTPAKAFTFQWMWTDGVTLLVSSSLVTIKDSNYFSSTATGIVGSVMPKQLLDIVKSWKFI